MKFIRKLVNRVKWFVQRRQRGFDDRELWSLDITIAEFVLPRLKAFKDLDIHRKDKKWLKSIDKMIFAFEKIANGEMIMGSKCSEVEQKKVEEGLTLFRKNFLGLWY